MKNSNKVEIKIPGEPSTGDPFASRFTDPSFRTGKSRNVIVEVADWGNGIDIKVKKGESVWDATYNEALIGNYTWRYIDEMQLQQWRSMKVTIDSLKSHEDQVISELAIGVGKIFRDGSRKQLATNIIRDLNKVPSTLNDQQKQQVLVKMLLLAILGVAERASA